MVPDHYNPDSNRIFDPNVDDTSIGDSRLNKTHINRIIAPPQSHPSEPERRNCPQPWHSRFIRHNVRILNEPACVMATNDTDVEQDNWWPSRTSDEALKIPEFNKDTTQRSDFQNRGVRKPTGRHASNPLITPSHGILPVATPKRENDDGDCLLEKISYTHNYDCRSNPTEPIRGKLHGSFVWDRVIKNPEGNHVISTPWSQRDITRSGAVVISNQPKSANIDATIQPETIPPIDGLPPL